MAHYARYLTLLEQHNSTLPPEQQSEPLPYWPDSFTREDAHEELCHLYAHGGDARRLAILLGKRLRWPGPPDAALQP
jgi:hypothetical protein